MHSLVRGKEELLPHPPKKKSHQSVQQEKITELIHEIKTCKLWATTVGTNLLLHAYKQLCACNTVSNSILENLTYTTQDHIFLVEFDHQLVIMP